MLDSKCRHMKPEQFFVENLTPGREKLEAEALCSGCPVHAECAEDALQPMNVTRLLEAHYDFTDDVEDLVAGSGVVRAGEIMQVDGA